MEIVLCVLFGIILNFLITRPIGKYKAREYCKSKGLEKDLPKFKWYEWWF